MPPGLLKTAARSVAICLAVGISLSLRLAGIYQAEGYAGLRENPLAFWLPLAIVAAATTYFTVLTILAPRRFFIGASILLTGLSVILAVVHLIFNDVGNKITEVLTPFVVHLVGLMLLLVCTRVLRFRLAADDKNTPQALSSEWRFPVSDLLLLSTGVAIFLSVVHQFQFFWYTRAGNFHGFLLYIGVCISVTAFVAVWAALGRRWYLWGPLVLILVPLNVVPARQMQVTLLFPVYWLGIFVAIHTGLLVLLLGILRFQGYRLQRIPSPLRKQTPESEQA